jgi:hypothetical protein
VHGGNTIPDTDADMAALARTLGVSERYARAYAKRIAYALRNAESKPDPRADAERYAKRKRHAEWRAKRNPVRRADVPRWVRSTAHRYRTSA